MTRRYLRGYVLRDDTDAAADTAAGPLRIIAATAGRKGDGLNLTMDGADLARFEGNPVVGYGHSYWGRDGLPIGRSDKTWIDGDRLLMDITFDQEDEFARTVERKYRHRYLNAFSIGFDVWGVGEDGVPDGWELFEVSAVPLPMDPNAVVEAGRELDLARALGDLQSSDLVRAGAVLSKKNLTLVQNAATALEELLAAAGGTDEGEYVIEDDERQAPAVDHARLRRLAGI
ncbi:hypothetical protein [Streptomyces sp. NPDC060198]|uniref:hypothetical protein n=1 Tax=Streptomyces sp. NPDC060198 TaxID=3347070 RepID=UPI003668AC01